MQAPAGRARRLIEGGACLVMPVGREVLSGGVLTPWSRPCRAGLLETAAPDRGKEFANNAEAGARLGGTQSYLSQAHRP